MTLSHERIFRRNTRRFCSFPTTTYLNRILSDVNVSNTYDDLPGRALYLYKTCSQLKAHAHRRTDPLRKIALCLSICGMHTLSDSTRRSGNPTRWFRTCDNIGLLLYAYRERSDLRGAKNGAFGVQRTLFDAYPYVGVRWQTYAHRGISAYPSIT